MFYIILEGSVTVRKKNPDIKDWKFKYTKYEELKEWKKAEFDPKAREYRLKYLDDPSQDMF